MGYYGNNNNNQCDPCQGGCVRCAIQANNCTSCTPYNGNDYFKSLGANTCVTICGDGTYGDPSTYSCIECPYFSYLGKCLLTCPNETNVDLTTNRTVCQNCTAQDNSCVQQYAFTVTTTVSSDGTSMIHNVYLPEGLSASVTTADLAGAVVYLVQQTTSRRLLSTLTPLDVKSIVIERPNNILVTTNILGNIDLTTAKIQINFPGGSLITANGIPYSSTTATFALSDPIFTGSYFKVYNDTVITKIMGIVFISISILFIIILLILPEKRTYH